MLNSFFAKATGSIKNITANQPLFLADSDKTFWWIRSGSVAVFAVSVGQGTPAAARRYLFSLEAGAALFNSELEESDRQLLVVPIEPTELLQYTISTEKGDFQINPTALLEAWIDHLSAALQSENTIAYTKNTATGQSLSSLELEAGQTYQSSEIDWLQVQTGCFSWMGLKSLDVETGRFPLSHHAWIKAEQRSTLTISATQDLNWNQILSSLAVFHAVVFDAIACLEQQEAQSELQRFAEKERLNQQVTESAFGELASILIPKQKRSFFEGDALLIAMGAIGRSLNIEIRPPAKSENLSRLKDPLEAIVRSSRIRSRRVLLRGDWWRQDAGALLAYRKADQSPVTLLPIRGARYDLFDPTDQSRSLVTPEVAATLAPESVMFYRPLPATLLNAGDLIRFAGRGRFKDFATVIVMGIVGSVLGMVVPQATGILMDSAIPNSDRSLVLQLALGLAATAFGSTMFQLTQTFASLRSETASDATTQAAVWDRLLNLRMGFFRRYSVGDLQSRVTAISSIRQQLSSTTLRTLFSGFFSLLNLGLLMFYSFKLSIVAIVVALISIIVTTVSGVLLLRKQRPLLELQGTIFGLVVQLINGISKLRVAGAEERAFAYWSRRYSQQIKLEISTQLIEDVVILFNTIMPTLTSIALYWFVVGMLTKPETALDAEPMSTGTFLAFSSAFGTFISGATSLSNTTLSILSVIPLWKRAKPILEELPEVDQSKADPGRLAGGIKIDHVVFRYRMDGALTLDDVSLEANPGEFIALIGPSGSGKSTILRLLLGFDTPELGSIFYDGQDLAGLDIYAVRRQIGVVLQNARINSASIFDNIASGAQVTMDEAWEAAQMAGFAEDIQAMPMGMHTVISEGGSNLSGGQRQRLIIARALVLKPRILFFDEATSALDNRTQAIVSESLDRLNVTRIVIAHRLSTIRNADRIYVLQAGRVVQVGNFDQLAKQNGLFSQLIARQVV
ncbi:NHLP bacteriocin export ABC transporter permease/ATPase subunit [Leptolyngbya sp. DQ-M1]|uniref:NHLP bacteriocin export ABC transporter permease/ATPase subunit n=1 Tax=Leptolyngbya sp. DQ-M1 TaxID=2933920 RepID=UPI003298DF47